MRQCTAKTYTCTKCTTFQGQLIGIHNKFKYFCLVFLTNGDNDGELVAFLRGFQGHQFEPIIHNDV